MAAVFFHDEVASALQRAWPESPAPALIDAWRARVLRHVEDKPVFRRRERWGTCAVVGSSGALMYAAHGERIDGHDAVFRINGAPVRGLERHVGSKTTYRVWAGRDTPEEQRWRGDNGSIVFFCQPTRWVSRCWHRLSEKQTAAVVQTPPYPRLSPLLWKGVRADILRANPTARGWQRRGATPSAGAVTLFIALRLCAQVELFGFGDDSSSSPWNCPMRGPLPWAGSRFFRDGGPLALCGKYYRDGARGDRPVSPRLACGSKSKFSRYLNVTKNYHDLCMEWRWIESEVRSGRVRTPPCSCKRRDAAGFCSFSRPGRCQMTRRVLRD